MRIRSRGVQRLEKDCQNSDIVTKRSLLNVVDVNRKMSISTPVLNFSHFPSNYEYRYNPRSFTYHTFYPRQ